MPFWPGAPDVGVVPDRIRQEMLSVSLWNEADLLGSFN